MKMPHTGCPRGKRVRVVLRDGVSFIDKFWDRTHCDLIFGPPPNQRHVAIKAVKSFTIVRK
jgi:hypothetical protein